MKIKWESCSEEELQFRVGEWLRSPQIQKVLPQSLILLEGEMGAGKSTLVRAMLKHLCPEQISHGSPTFPIVQEYTVGGNLPLYHIDLYRLKTEQELYDSGIDDLLDTLPSIVCVEWASLFPDYFEFWKKSSELKRRTLIEVKIDSVASDPSLRNFSIKA